MVPSSSPPGGPSVLAQQLAVVAGLILVVLGVAGFVGVFDAVQEADDLAVVDEPVLNGLAAMRTGVLTGLLTAVTTVSGPVVLPVVVLVAAAVWGLVRREWWQPLLLAGAMVAATLVSMTIKAVVARPRPPVDVMSVAGAETSYSFPSGHTLAAATFLLVLGYLVWIRHPSVLALVIWLAVGAAGTVLVALSRLYLGYHFVSDVAASVALAVAVLGAVVVLDRRRAVHAAHRTATTHPPHDPGPGPEVG